MTFDSNIEIITPVIYDRKSGYQHNPVNIDTAFRRGDTIIAFISVIITSSILLPGVNKLAQNSIGTLVNNSPVITNKTKKQPVDLVKEAEQTDKNINKGTNPKFSGIYARALTPSDNIANFPVTSAFGPRQSPCVGCSSIHQGVDIGTPIGTPLYAVGTPGTTVNVRCWDNGKWGWVASWSVPEWGLSFDHVHIKAEGCKSGNQPVGSVIALSGTAGTGPHLHFQMRKGSTSGDKIAPLGGYAYMALTGKLP